MANDRGVTPREPGITLSPSEYPLIELEHFELCLRLDLA